MSALHRRFGGSTFALPLSALLASLLTVPPRVASQEIAADQRERDEQVRVPRQKVLMRATAELAFSEITRQEKGKEKATSEGDLNRNPGGEWLFSIFRDMVSAS